MKRVVLLTYKDTGDTSVYPSCVELTINNGVDKIGISLAALWNGLSVGNGHFENKKCIIEYKDIIQSKKWQRR